MLRPRLQYVLLAVFVVVNTSMEHKEAALFAAPAQHDKHATTPGQKHFGSSHATEHGNLAQASRSKSALFEVWDLHVPFSTQNKVSLVLTARRRCPSPHASINTTIRLLYWEIITRPVWTGDRLKTGLGAIAGEQSCP